MEDYDNPDISKIEVSPVKEHDNSKTSKGLISQEKLTASQWKSIEQNASPRDKLVIDALLSLIVQQDKKRNTDNNLGYCGDQIYLDIIRSVLLDREVVNILPEPEKEDKKSKNKKSKKIKQKKLKKAELIIMENKKRKISESFQEIVDIIFKTGNPSYGFASNYIEIRLATMLLYSKLFESKKKKTNQERFDLIQGMQKILHIAKQYSNISEIVKTDFSDRIECLKKMFGFTYEILFEKFPQSVYFTEYDDIFPTLTIQPYRSQKLLMEYLTSNSDILVFYKAMIGTGKTSSILPICAWIDQQRKTNKVKTQIIFCCSIEPVRHQVGKLAYNAGFKFGIGTTTDQGRLNIVNHYSCRKNEDRLLVIADLKSTHMMLSESQDYVLFLDEPTVCADQEDHGVTRIVSQILVKAPKVTILSSATLPSEKEFEHLVTHFKDKYPDVVTKTILSRETKIGCDLIGMDGNQILPYDNCKSEEIYKNVLSTIDSNPFLGRLLSAPILFSLWNIFNKVDDIDLPSLQEYFSNPNNLNQNGIRDIILVLLNKLIGNPEHMKLLKNTFGRNEPINLKKIATTDAHKCFGGCLIAVNEPEKVAVEIGKDILDEVESIQKIIGIYKKNLSRYEAAIEKMKSRIKNDDDRSKEEDTMCTPTLNFPSYLQINTFDHIKKYIPEQRKTMQSKSPLILESIPTDLNIPDEFITLLYAGIGVYNPDNEDFLKSGYTNLVLELAISGSLAFVVSNDSICYGADLPFCHVIIGSDLAENHSISTIYQLMGRTGRVGKSWRAQVHLTCEKLEKRIRDNFVVDEDSVSIEAINLQKELRSCLWEYNKMSVDLERFAEKEALERVKITKPSSHGSFEPLQKRYQSSKNRRGFVQKSRSSNSFQQMKNSQDKKRVDVWRKSKVPDVKDKKNSNTNFPSRQIHNDKSRDMVYKGRPSDYNRSQDRPYYDTRRQDRPYYDTRRQDRPSYDTRRQDRPSYDTRRQDRPSYDTRRQDIPSYDTRRQDRSLYGNRETENPFDRLHRNPKPENEHKTPDKSSYVPPHLRRKD